MAQKQFSEMTEEELKKRKNELTFAIIISAIAIIIMSVTSIMSYSRKGYSTFTILPLIFIPLLTINLINLKKIKAELALRKQ
jgi:membrane-associated HD superfamily phosphohydrolase